MALSVAERHVVERPEQAKVSKKTQKKVLDIEESEQLQWVSEFARYATCTGYVCFL